MNYSLHRQFPANPSQYGLIWGTFHLTFLTWNSNSNANIFQLEFDSWKSDHIDDFVQDCSNSSALVMELLQFVSCPGDNLMAPTFDNRRLWVVLMVPIDIDPGWCKIQMFFSRKCLWVPLSVPFWSRKWWINSLWPRDATYIWVSIGSSDGLLPYSSKPLPKPVLTYHQWGMLALSWGQFHINCSRYQSV